METGGEVLVCDLQGVRDNPTMGYWLTDNPPRQEYGITDMGNAGIHKFFATHKCTTGHQQEATQRKPPAHKDRYKTELQLQ